MSEEQSDGSRALFNVIEALRPLPSDERHRTVAAAMMFLGETTSTSRKIPIVVPEVVPADHVEDRVNDDFDRSSFKAAWMKQHRISTEELDQVFHFHSDGSFDLLNAPGKWKKEQTLNTYVLAGLGHYLASDGDRNFDDSSARQFCERIGCYDQANHAAHLKSRGNEFTGDKSRGYSLTNPGIKRGAALVKEVAGEAV